MDADRARLERALEAVEPAAEGFRSAVARTMDEIRARLDAQAETSDAGQAGSGLGPLGRGLIDVERFAQVFEDTELLDEEATGALRRSMETLAELDAAGEESFLLELPSGARLAPAVADALARLGRAFGAARLAEAARSGRPEPGVDGDPLTAFPAGRWNRAERSVAPPLVVSLRGEDLRAAALAELLDGNQKIVLVVQGDAPPAPLVALVSPSVMVLQSRDAAELAMVAEHEGPAVAALFPESSKTASFLHDPDAGGTLAERLAVRERPDGETLRPLGQISVFRQREELLQLGALLAGAGAVSGPSTNGVRAGDAAGADEEGVEPADRLAAWLLRQSNLSGLS